MYKLSFFFTLFISFTNLGTGDYEASLKYIWFSLSEPDVVEPLKAESISESVCEQLLDADNKSQATNSDSESAGSSDSEVEEEKIKEEETKTEQEVNISHIMKNGFEFFCASFAPFSQSEETEHFQLA